MRDVITLLHVFAVIGLHSQTFPNAANILYSPRIQHAYRSSRTYDQLIQQLNTHPAVSMQEGFTAPLHDWTLWNALYPAYYNKQLATSVLHAVQKDPNFNPNLVGNCDITMPGPNLNYQCSLLQLAILSSDEYIAGKLMDSGADQSAIVSQTDVTTGAIYGTNQNAYQFAVMYNKLENFLNNYKMCANIQTQLNDITSAFSVQSAVPALSSVLNSGMASVVINICHSGVDNLLIPALYNPIQRRFADALKLVHFVDDSRINGVSHVTGNTALHYLASQWDGIPKRQLLIRKLLKKPTIKLEQKNYVGQNFIDIATPGGKKLIQEEMCIIILDTNTEAAKRHMFEEMIPDLEACKKPKKDKKILIFILVGLSGVVALLSVLVAIILCMKKY